MTGPHRPPSLRMLYVHLIGEYARHNGHVDLVRQHIDGVTRALKRGDPVMAPVARSDHRLLTGRAVSGRIAP
ncbi:MAG: mycothiol transferase [Nocardioides sp.]